MPWMRFYILMRFYSFLRVRHMPAKHCIAMCLQYQLRSSSSNASSLTVLSFHLRAREESPQFFDKAQVTRGLYWELEHLFALNIIVPFSEKALRQVN